MQIIEKIIPTDSKSNVFYIYPIGDTHIGKSNCAESYLRAYVKYIAHKKNAFWFGGGDLCNCIMLNDPRHRWDDVADWLLEGKALTIKEKLKDIAKQERQRFVEIIEPIKDKCLGLLTGNHEDAMMQHLQSSHHDIMCDELNTFNLTDCAAIRLNFRNPHGAKASIRIWITHGEGAGGGRTAGAEPNALNRLQELGDFDIFLRGHSHNWHIMPPRIRLFIPTRGELPDQLLQKEVWAANWGCWLLSYKRGGTTWESKQCYAPKPLKALEISIKPAHDNKIKKNHDSIDWTHSQIMINQCQYPTGV